MRRLYDCSKCPAYCCSYANIVVSKRDLDRIAKHFEIDPETAARRFTKSSDQGPVLRQKKDEVYGSVCIFLDVKTRRCSIYEARPAVCQDYPDRPRCGYYEFLKWEREFQDDPEFIPLKRG